MWCDHGVTSIDFPFDVDVVCTTRTSPSCNVLINNRHTTHTIPHHSHRPSEAPHLTLVRYAGGVDDNH